MMVLPMNRRTLVLLVELVPLAAMFVYVALRSGPLTPIPGDCDGC